MTPEPLTASSCIVRDTAAHTGRAISVTPGKTASRHLHYGRIILEPGDGRVSFDTGDRETGLVCLGTAATVEVEGVSYALGRYDALYIPRGAAVIVSAGAQRTDLAEVAARVERRHPVQVVRFDEIRNDPTLHVDAGGPTAKRDLNVLLGKNVSAGRIMAGVTFSEPGNRSEERRVGKECRL